MLKMIAWLVRTVKQFVIDATIWVSPKHEICSASNQQGVPLKMPTITVYSWDYLGSSCFPVHIVTPDAIILCCQPCWQCISAPWPTLYLGCNKSMNYVLLLTHTDISVALSSHPARQVRHKETALGGIYIFASQNYFGIFLSLRYFSTILVDTSAG